MTTTAPVTAPAIVSPADIIRVEKGAPTEEELAALTAVLLARCAHASASPVECLPSLVHWSRPDRVQGHRATRSWRTERRKATPAADPAERE